MNGTVFHYTYVIHHFWTKFQVYFGLYFILVHFLLVYLENSPFLEFLCYNNHSECIGGFYMKTLDLIRQNMPSFTKKEALIAEYILNQDPVFVIQCTGEMIARNAKSSKSAFIRMCQKLGYEGFSEFKFALSREMVSNTNDENNEDEPQDSMKAITNFYARQLININQMISMNEVKALGKKIVHSRKVKIIGYNRTGLSAMQLRMRLSKIRCRL